MLDSTFGQASAMKRRHDQVLLASPTENKEGLTGIEDLDDLPQPDLVQSPEVPNDVIDPTAAL